MKGKKKSLIKLKRKKAPNKEFVGMILKYLELLYIQDN